MDYTNSLDNIIDPGTGHRMHQDDQALPTVLSAQDANTLFWELMEILKAGGIVPKAFNKDDPQSYNTVLRALRAMDFTTRPQGDNTDKAATTKFVQQAVLLGRTGYAVKGANASLNITHINNLTFVAPCNGKLLALSTVNLSSSASLVTSALFFNGVQAALDSTPLSMANSNSIYVAAGQTMNISQQVTNTTSTVIAISMVLNYIFVPGA